MKKLLVFLFLAALYATPMFARVLPGLGVTVAHAQDDNDQGEDNDDQGEDEQ